ncbi:MAG: protein-L-isoaspartate(D-aspartate) O-methyltransferase [Rhodothermales bacterium]|nr:protein-L-isoaspartate(D-aspartate) O-methyltransferase [Rhodothermales bacterium]MBO6778398.1 protein-L-isoaspartate(D-aspartate) O-methyltransferase [Rhodothermales bacterium]
MPELDPKRRFRRQRQALVDLLRQKGIQDERVLAAMGEVPRHLFMDQALQRRAYEDEALPIGLSQTISQPFTVAYQTERLATRPGERILEIGTGSGYQAAVLATLGVSLFSVERLRPLFERSRTLLRDLGYRVNCRHGDGTKGWETVAPFDGIIVTAGAIGIPPALLEQLREPEDDRPGGRLIIPVGGSGGQVMQRVVRRGANNYEREEFDGFSFVPLIPD